MTGNANYTRSIRDEIKAKRTELKALEAKAKASRDEKKAISAKGREAQVTLVAQVQFLFQEQPGQVETAAALLDGLFTKRELAGEFKAFLELFQERRTAFKAKMSEKKVAARAAKDAAKAEPEPVA